MIMTGEAMADQVFRSLINGQDKENLIRIALYGKLAVRGAFLSEIHTLLVQLGESRLSAMLLLPTMRGQEGHKLIRRALEAFTGVTVWMRKDHLRREDGSTKNMTIGTRVVTLDQRSAYMGSQGRVRGGQHGKVEDTGTAMRSSAKAAIGTTAALRVRLDPTGGQ